MLYVITGAPFAHKTTLIRHLGELGYSTIPEAALEVIEEYGCLQYYDDGWEHWRRSIPEHETAFALAVALRQLSREVIAAYSDKIIFSDRGYLDSMAFCQMRGVTFPEFDVHSQYRAVFVLLAQDEDTRRKTGRIDTLEENRAITPILIDVYKNAGYDVFTVGNYSSNLAVNTATRAQVILSTIAKLKGFDLLDGAGPSYGHETG